MVILWDDYLKRPCKLLMISSPKNGGRKSLLAGRIGGQAGGILTGLEQAERNTAALAGLNTTIASAVAIIDGLKRGRKKLGG